MVNRGGGIGLLLIVQPAQFEVGRRPISGFTSTAFSKDSMAPLKSMVLTRLLPAKKYGSFSSSLGAEGRQPLSTRPASSSDAIRKRPTENVMA